MRTAQTKLNVVREDRKFYFFNRQHVNVVITFTINTEIIKLLYIVNIWYAYSHEQFLQVKTFKFCLILACGIY